MATKAFYSVSVFCIYVRATEVEAANMTKMVFEDQRDRSANPWVRTQHLKKSRIAYRISHRDLSAAPIVRLVRSSGRQAGRQAQTADPPIPNLPGANAAAAGPDIKIAQQSAEEWGVALPGRDHERAARFYACYFFAHK